MFFDETFYSHLESWTLVYEILAGNLGSFFIDMKTKYLIFFEWYKFRIHH